MGRPLIQQKRGKGGPRYRVPKQSFSPRVKYRNLPGRVVDIMNYRLMSTPVAKILYENRETGYTLAPEGIKVGDELSAFVMPLSQIAAGTQIFGIETVPNSGPKLCRTAGSSAILVSKDSRNAIVRLPSKKKKTLSVLCKAMIGTPAGDGRKEKPWVKAGKKHHAMKHRGKYFHRTSGTKMNAVDHPFGGPSKRPGKSKSMSRHAPPGRKAGSLSSKRTGRKKK